MPIFRVLIRTLTRPWPLFTAAVIIALCFAARILLPVYFESIPVIDRSAVHGCPVCPVHLCRHHALSRAQRRSEGPDYLSLALHI